MEKQQFSTYEEFWPFYLSQHSRPATRFWHFIGTSFVFIFLVSAFLVKWWLVFLAPVVAYGLAWYSHFFIEGNKPATFGHPGWSLRADFHMYFCLLTGRLGNELKKYDMTA